MQRHYDEFNAAEVGLGRTMVAWAVILAIMVMLCTVWALDASFTPEQRTALFQLSGYFP
jgi:hypothetical protein